MLDVTRLLHMLYVLLLHYVSMLMVRYYIDVTRLLRMIYVLWLVLDGNSSREGFAAIYSTDRAKVHTKFANSKYANLTYGPNTHHQYSFAVNTQHKILSAFYQTRIDT